jgi:hypothetical protein
MGWSALAAITTLPGIALRYLASSISKQPFTYLKGNGPEKTLPQDGKFSLLSWNICGTGAGYAISDGGVYPLNYRIDPIVDTILKKDADVACLYEVFDVNTGVYLYDQLKDKGYNHFYFNMGTKAIGVASGLFVASKYKIETPEFSPFPLESLVGRTKNCGKGVFSFDLKSEENTFATLFTTHLQHSEEPAFPTSEEVAGRAMQMRLIDEKATALQGRCVIVTGDINLGDAEYKTSAWHTHYQKGERSEEIKTWGGDQFCATLVGQKVSGPLNLDHTMILKGSAASIETTLVETGYDSAQFNPAALSDHEGTFNSIKINEIG